MTELVPIQDEVFPVSIIEPAANLAERLARTEFVPSALRNKPASVLACMLTGHEIGIGPMQALSKVHVIDGRPSMAAELMRALVQREGHEIWTEDLTNTRVTICGQRRGSEHVSKVTWTLDDAKKAGLDGKQNWRRYPRAMLLARATGELCRLMFADVLGGISYVPEELADGVDDTIPWETDDDGGDQAEEKPKTQTRKAAPTKKAAAKKAAPAKKAAATRQAPPAPPLPGEDDDEDGDGGEDPQTVTKRAQQIAMRANELGVDRADVIFAVTGGRKTSAKDVDAEEGAAVLEALRQIKTGEKHVAQGEDGAYLADGRPAFPDDEEPAEPDDDQDDGDATTGHFDDIATWGGEDWRAFIREHGVKVAETLREAQRMAADTGDQPPATLDQLGNLPADALTLLRGFVEELGLERKGG